MIVRVVATRSNTPISWLIRLITNSPYSHLGIKLNNKFMIDADWGGVKIRKLPKKYDEFIVNNISIDNFKIGNRWLMNQRGKSYDFLGVISTAIYNMFGKKRTKNNLHDPDKYTCSEYVFRYFEEMNTALLYNVDSANFQPSHLPDSKARLIHKGL